MRVKILLCFTSLLLFISAEVLEPHHESELWGFYGHRLINRTAVFTLPVDLIPLYKSNIDFVTEHAIDPDKRRYASPLEAVRHYIDLDVWGTPPFNNLPRSFPHAMVEHSEVHVLTKEGRDTVKTWESNHVWQDIFTFEHKKQVVSEVQLKTYELLDQGYLNLPSSWLPPEYDAQLHELIFVERLTEYGILPYHLSLYQGRLTRAFKDKNWPLVIRLSTELGHYLSDAHVPLHTTENYNGQLTGQDGIHAFWESRIPELFAESNYDFFVGRAKYIEETDPFFWDIVLDSHSYVEEVLGKEMELRDSFDKDKQYCFEERGANTTRMECREYAEAYQDAMAGMVEAQMRKSIQAIGSSWYTAWVDAGRPNFTSDLDVKKIDTLTLISVDSLALDH